MKAVDCFAGCGGLSRGFQDAGVEILAALELWEAAAKCYEANFKHPVLRVDLSNVCEATKAISKYNPDIIIGGPPCQDFSQAGKRIEAARADLSGSYAEIVSAVKPKYFLMENVDRAQHSNAFAYAESVYRAAGYGITKMVLDSSLCGAPQKRKRFICVGCMGAADNWLTDILRSHLAKQPMTLRQYMGDEIDFNFYYRHPRNYSRRAVFSVDEPAPTMRGVNRPVPKGYPGHENDACPVKEGVRALTTKERARVQTFPIDWKWIGSKTDVEQMIGNAVPVELGKYIARALLEYDSTEHPLNRKEFARWLTERGTYSQDVVKDTASRLKRANTILFVNGKPDDLYLYNLSHSKDFQELSKPVQSQLKKAIRLYGEFLDQRKRNL